jgi:hypothetical protein
VCPTGSGQVRLSDTGSGRLLSPPRWGSVAVAETTGFGHLSYELDGISRGGLGDLLRASNQRRTAMPTCVSAGGFRPLGVKLGGETKGRRLVALRGVGGPGDDPDAAGAVADGLGQVQGGHPFGVACADVVGGRADLACHWVGDAVLGGGIGGRDQFRCQQPGLVAGVGAVLDLAGLLQGPDRPQADDRLRPRGGLWLGSGAGGWPAGRPCLAGRRGGGGSGRDRCRPVRLIGSTT